MVRERFNEPVMHKKMLKRYQAFELLSKAKIQ